MIDIKNIIKYMKFSEFKILIISITIFVFLSIASPYFLGSENIQNFLLQSVFVGFVSFGMTFVLMVGGIDLSVGSTLGLSGAVTGMCIAGNAGVPISIMCGLLCGVLVGFINGFLITKLKIAPFLVTLAISYILRGMLQLRTTNGAISGFAVPSFVEIAQGHWFGLPIPVVILFAVFIVLFFLTKYTSYGRYVVAVGSNKQAAYLSGVSCNKVIISAYVLSGLMSSIAGILLASRLASVVAEMGTGYEMDAIAAAVIGGTSMAGGFGSILGTLIGSTIMGMISNGLNLLSVNQFYRQIIVGLIIVLAVVAKKISFGEKNKK